MRFGSLSFLSNHYVFSFSLASVQYTCFSMHYDDVVLECSKSLVVTLDNKVPTKEEWFVDFIEKLSRRKSSPATTGLEARSQSLVHHPQVSISDNRILYY